MKSIPVNLLFTSFMIIVLRFPAQAAGPGSQPEPGNRIRRDTVAVPLHTDTAARVNDVPSGAPAPPLRVSPKAVRKPNFYEGHAYTFGGHVGISSARAVNSSGDIISSPVTGLTAGVFIQHGLNIFGGRTELNYSRMGFTYNSNGSKGQILNDYLSLATLATLTIRHRVQLQLGTQQGYLLSSKDSNGPGTAGGNPITALNRFDFGLTGGLEVYPYNGFTLGIRYNLGLTSLVKRQDNSTASYIPFLQQAGGYNVRNGVLQVLIGYQLPL